jgi:hypothetical protein
MSTCPGPCRIWLYRIKTAPAEPAPGLRAGARGARPRPADSLIQRSGSAVRRTATSHASTLAPSDPVSSRMRTSARSRRSARTPQTGRMGGHRRHHRPNSTASSASMMNGINPTAKRNHTARVQRRGTESARKAAMPGSCCASSPPLVTTLRLLRAPPCSIRHIWALVPPPPGPCRPPSSRSAAWPG